MRARARERASGGQKSPLRVLRGAARARALGRVRGAARAQARACVGAGVRACAGVRVFVRARVQE
jgi:hypothetical protein